MKYLFYLKSNKKDISPIYIDIRMPSQRKRIPTGISVIKKNWDSKKNVVKLSDNNSFFKNTKLKNISEILDKYIIETPKIKHNIFDAIELLKINDSKDNQNELDLVDNFIDYIYKEYTTIGSQKKLLNLKMILGKYKKGLRFSELTIKDLDGFSKLLVKNGYSNSYIIRTVALFKTLMRNYHKINPNIDISYLNNFKNIVQNKYSTLIALDESEIKCIQEYLPSENLVKIKDLFLIQCSTGLRVSDLLNLKKENIDKVNNEILLTTIKTSELIRIPITNKIIPIFEKYNYELPKISDVKYNKYLKELCKSAGIETPTLITSWNAGSRIDEIKPKYQLITSHTARRTFITRLLRKGLLPEQIMKITGHRNRRSFDEYVKITQSEAIDAVRNALD